MQTVPDGSRVNVVLLPLALDGPVLTIRRFRPRGFAPSDLVAHGTLPAPLLDFLGRAVRARCTLLICGGTGSGKTTTLGALAAFVEPRERIVTIEDAAELRIALPHVVRLSAQDNLALIGLALPPALAIVWLLQPARRDQRTPR